MWHSSWYSSCGIIISCVVVYGRLWHDLAILSNWLEQTSAVCPRCGHQADITPQTSPQVSVVLNSPNPSNSYTSLPIPPLPRPMPPGAKECICGRHDPRRGQYCGFRGTNHPYLWLSFFYQKKWLVLKDTLCFLASMRTSRTEWNRCRVVDNSFVQT